MEFSRTNTYRLTQTLLMQEKGFQVEKWFSCRRAKFGSHAMRANLFSWLRAIETVGKLLRPSDAVIYKPAAFLANKGKP
jgi:hypothetical protein